MIDFETWWADHGARTQAFDAKAWCLAGWLGHKMHGGEAPIEEEAKQIEAPENKAG